MALVVLSMSGAAQATTSAMFDKENAIPDKKEFSPYVNRQYPTQVYFGDTHLHTSLSMDVGTFGNRLGLDAAYKFVRGAEVNASKGFKAKLGKPLDFVVTADHSDCMGFFEMFSKGNPAVMDKEEGRRWNKAINEGGQASVDAALEIITLFSQGQFPWHTNDPEMMKPVWGEVIEAAETYSEPGRFTAFIGYEWTSLVKGNNLHRVVIYRDGATQARQTLPFTLADSADPEDLWEAMQHYGDRTGGDLLAIPHNGNLANGLMFDVETLSGKPIEKHYAELRQKWEPLYETTQIKGDGEAHPLLSPDDEFADYEIWDLGNLEGIEIIKGGIDGEDPAREQIYDVALSMGRNSRPFLLLTHSRGDRIVFLTMVLRCVQIRGPILIRKVRGAVSVSQTMSNNILAAKLISVSAALLPLGGGIQVVVSLEGILRSHVMARDVAFHLIRHHGDEIEDKAVMLTGSAVDKMNISEKMTLCNLLPQSKVRTVLVLPQGEKEKVDITLAAHRIEPMLALPSVPVKIVRPHEWERQKITVAIAGGCSSGRLDDMQVIADVLSKNEVHQDVTFIITPGSRSIMGSMDRMDLSTTLRNSGAVIMPPGCGPCPGKHLGVLTKDDVAITTTPRNSPGRIGSSEAKIYLASPLTVALSAVHGQISEPTEMM